jgi:putative endonuclease
MNRESYVYILASKKNGTIYVGVTSDLGNRVLEHKRGVFPGFTDMYEVKTLVYYEVFGDITTAIYREKRLKKCSRKRKVDLIERCNPEWIDLAEDWYSFQVC